MNNLDIDIGNRLRQIRESKRLNQKDFGCLLNVIPQTYSKYEKGERGVTDEIKIQLYKMGISLSWLLTGEGDMFISDKSLCVAGEDCAEYGTNRNRIPLLGQKVSCGPGQNWDSEDNIIEYIDVSELSPSIQGKDVYAFRAAGTSMLGAGIKDGDIVLFSAAQNQKLSDGIYVFGLDGEAYCKRLEFDPIAQRIKIYSVRVADLEKAELLTTLTASDPGYAERFTLFGRVFSWIHVINSYE